MEDKPKEPEVVLPPPAKKPRKKKEKKDPPKFHIEKGPVSIKFD